MSDVALSGPEYRERPRPAANGLMAPELDVPVGEDNPAPSEPLSSSIFVLDTTAAEAKSEDVDGLG